MDLGVISVRYARALLKSAMALKQDAEVYQEMQMLYNSYLQVPQLRFTIDNPMLSKEKKQDIVETAAGGNICEQTRRFFHLVLKEGREEKLQLMAASYITLYRRENNITRGKLITAVAVSDQIETKMKQMVEHKTNGTVEFNTEVDPDIIGGFILEYDTYRMDASVKSKLNNILIQLKK
ncbi:F0F1 ATP synthase subunit delta [Hallella colorans]|uniref:F0F1 ATP synthase subunit delta n=1 Tax=Hallella colorans TaxID=1703337 RepID=UPI00248D7B39|nr:F0F1 ATP synthase subunit delta [Hallella colorans]